MLLLTYTFIEFSNQHMHTLLLPLEKVTILAHHSVGVSTFWNCSIQQSSSSTCDFSGRGILRGVARAYVT